MSSAPDVGAADRACMLGRAWLERGHDDAAFTHLQRALALAPGHREAHRQLAHWHVRRSDFLPALEHMSKALAEAPPESPLRQEWMLLRQLAGLGRAPAEL